MDSYGVVPIGDHLLSVPGAFLYLIGIFLGVMLSWGLTVNNPVRHFRFTKFAIFAVMFSVLTTLLWMYLGVWFYVKA